MIVTFYSFKGGVGRSHMLVETAVRLAKSGRSVLVWDLDLEAPGMQRLPDLRSVEERLQTGTLDLLTAFQESFELPRELLRTSTLDLNTPAITDRGGRLSFLLPAPLDETYASKFAGIRWHELFAPKTGAGPAFFHAVAKVLQEDLGFELLLIDSRTGFTDLGAVCTLQLPDLVVVVFNLNEQNLAGVERVHKAITATDARHIVGENSKIPALLLANMVPPKTVLRATAQPLRERKLAGLKEKGLKPHFTVELDVELLLTDAIAALHDEHRQPKELAQLAEEIDRRYAAITALTPSIALESEASFEKEVASLFSILGYEVAHQYKSGAETFDMRITRRTGLLDVALVECRAGVDLQAIEELGDRVERARAKDHTPYRALFVSRRPVESRPAGLVQVLDYDELAYSTIHAAALAENASAKFRGSALERLYIDLSVALESEPSVPAKLSTEISSWLERDRAPLFILLGDSGSGKTSFAKKLAADSSEEWRERRAGARLPVLINLADARETLDFLEFIAQQITWITAMPVPPEAVRLLNRAGKLLLIFDGLDEAGDLSISLLYSIFGEADGAAKILVTSTPELFRASAGELGGRPGSLRPAGATHAYFDALELNATLAELQPLTQEEIESYLRKAKPPPESWEQIAQRIATDEELRAIAERPFLLAMIAALEELDAQSRDLAPLYEAYCRPWFEGRPGSRIPSTRRAELVARLAQEAWTSRSGGAHFTVIASWKPGFRREEIDEELRWARFLRRDAEGNYRFSHSSFRSYFLAFALRFAFEAEGAAGLARALDAPRFGSDVFRFLAIRSADVELFLAARKLLDQGKQGIAANALMLVHTVGKSFAPVSCRNVSLSGADLSDADLEGIDLSGSTLLGCNFNGAKLSGASFDQAMLGATSFSFADLRNAVFRSAELVDVAFDHANLSKASFDDAALDGACRFDRAQLARAVFGDVSLDERRFRGARTLNVGALSAKTAPGTPRVPLGHTLGVLAVAWSSDGAYLASAGEDRRVLIWDAATGEVLQSLTLERGSISELAWAPNDEALAALATDFVAVFDALTGEPTSRVDTNAPPKVLSWSAGGRAIGYADGSVYIDRGEKGWHRELLNGGAITALAWSADQTLAIGSDAMLALLRTGPFEGLVRLSALSARLKLVSWLSSDEIVTLDANGIERVFDRAGTITRTFGSFGNPSSAAISPDKTRLAIRAHAQLNIVAIDSGSVIARSERPDHTPAIAWGAGDRIAAADQTSIAVVDSKLEERALLRGASALRTIDWSPRGTFLLAHGVDRALRVWSTKDTPRVGESVEVMIGRWRPDGALLAVATDESRILLLKSTSMRPVRELQLSQSQHWLLDRVWSMAWSADSQNLAVGYGSGSIRLFGRVERTLDGKHAIHALAWSDELLIALTAGGLNIWDAAAGTSVARIDASSVYASIAVHPQTSQIALSTNDGKLALWDPRTSKIDRTVEIHTERIFSVVFSPDGEAIAAATMDGTIALLDRALNRTNTLTGHQGPVTSLTWRKDGLLASTALDGAIKFWRDGACIATLYLLDHHKWVVCSESGYVAGSKDALSRVRFPDRWAQYTLEDLPDRLDPARALEGIVRTKKKKRRAKPA